METWLESDVISDRYANGFSETATGIKGLAICFWPSWLKPSLLGHWCKYKVKAFLFIHEVDQCSKEAAHDIDRAVCMAESSSFRLSADEILYAGKRRMPRDKKCTRSWKRCARRLPLSFPVDSIANCCQRREEKGLKFTIHYATRIGFAPFCCATQYRIIGFLLQLRCDRESTYLKWTFLGEIKGRNLIAQNVHTAQVTVSRRTAQEGKSRDARVKKRYKQKGKLSEK